MAKVKVAVYGTIGKIVSFDPNATVGAQIGANLLMPDGSVATLAKLIAAIGTTGTSTGASTGSTGAIAHRTLAGLTVGDDHPQYLRKDTLTTDGDIYVRVSGVPARVGVGAQYTVLMAGASLPAWTDISANPTGTIGLTAVNGTAHTFMRSDGAPALSQAIVPTWTAQHTFNLTPLVGAVKVALESRQVATGAGLTGGGNLTADRTIALSTSVLASTLLTTADETANFASSRRVLAGSGVTFDDTVSGVRTINATGTGGTVTSVDITPPAAGITASGGPIVGAGSITLALNHDLAAVEGLSTNGIVARTATDTWTTRTITGTASRIAVTNGDGVSGNPTLDIDAVYVGQSSITTVGTITTGVWHGTQIDLASYATGILPAASFPALTGDVTTVAGALATTIAANAVTTAKINNSAVTLAKIANQADQTILGNNTGGSAAPLALTAAQVKTILAITLTSDVTGTLQAAQFPALTGDVTTAAGSLATAIGANKVTTTTIAANAVTLAKLATQADQTFLGNNSGGAAVPSALTVTNVRTMLSISNVENTALSTWAGSTNLTTLGTITAGTWHGTAIDLGTYASGTLQAAQEPAHTGDVTNSAGSLTLTIAAASVTLAKMANLAASSILGNNTGSPATPIALTAAQVKTLLSIAYTDVSGLATVANSGAYGDLSGTPTIPTGANPSAVVGTAAVNGSAATFMRSDGAPAINLTMTPTWTGKHIFSPAAGTTADFIGPVTTSPAVRIIGSTSISGVPALSGAIVQYCSADTHDTVIQVDAVAGVPTVLFRRADGTGASPSAVQLNDVIGLHSARAYGTTGYGTSGRASITYGAAEAWTDTAQGANVTIQTTPAGGVVTQTSFKVFDDGHIQAWGIVAGALVTCQPDKGTYTGVATGFAATAPTVTMIWARNGNLVTMQIAAFSGTSNATGFTIPGTNIPNSIQPARAQTFVVSGLINAGTHETSVDSYLSLGTGGTMTLFKANSSSGWTNTGTKGFAQSVTFTYLLN